MSSFETDDLGRSAPKFDSLAQLLQELPFDKLRGEDLSEWVSVLHATFHPYSNPGLKKEPPSHASSQSELDTNPQFINFRACAALPVVADRIKWRYPPSFDPTPFLEPLLSSAYEEPAVLRKAASQWPPRPAAKVHCSRQELLRVASKWDALNAVKVTPASALPWDECVGLFSVSKSAAHDRLIINPTVANSRSHTITHYSRTLAPGSLLTLLWLEPHQSFRFAADDLSDYYYTFRISPSRAVRNSIRCRFEPAELAHLQCASGVSMEGPQLLSLNTLAMGDSLAVEVGQAALELWRHGELRGYRTRLQSEVSSILTEKGIPNFGAEEFGAQNLVPNPFKPVLQPPCSIPAPLQEGILFDCIEIFRGTGNWSFCHSEAGLVVRSGFDLKGPDSRHVDVLEASVRRELIALALRRVVREWHAGVPCVSFGTLRRPRVRSRAQPSGFDPEDPFTKLRNRLARLVGFVFCIALQYGQFVSVEQPAGTSLYHMHCYRLLVTLGCVVSTFCFCSFGSPFLKRSRWLRNKPCLCRLENSCQCGSGRRHFEVRGTFTAERLAEFLALAKPSVEAVYGCRPNLGQSVAEFSGAYPLRLASLTLHSCLLKLVSALPGGFVWTLRTFHLPWRLASCLSRTESGSRIPSGSASFAAAWFLKNSLGTIFVNPDTLT